jgi:hypothetical protein
MEQTNDTPDTRHANTPIASAARSWCIHESHSLLPPMFMSDTLWVEHKPEVVEHVRIPHIHHEMVDVEFVDVMT